MAKQVIAFDLDDTLYKEIDFVKSGYQAVLNELSKKYSINTNHILKKMLNSDNAFNSLLNDIKSEYSEAKENIDWCLNIYREHIPNITLSQDTYDTIIKLYNQSIPLCIITDGRTITQANKINSLGLYKLIDPEYILISENIGKDKFSSTAFEILMSFFSKNTEFVYIGDNTHKDFLWPNKLGWKTICIKDNGMNIHPQNFQCPIEYKPHFIVNNLSDILQLI